MFILLKDSSTDFFFFISNTLLFSSCGFPWSYLIVSIFLLTFYDSSLCTLFSFTSLRIVITTPIKLSANPNIWVILELFMHWWCLSVYFYFAWLLSFDFIIDIVKLCCRDCGFCYIPLESISLPHQQTVYLAESKFITLPPLHRFISLVNLTRPHPLSFFLLRHIVLHFPLGMEALKSVIFLSNF